MLRLDRRAGAIDALRAEIALLRDLVPEDLNVDHLEKAWALQDRYKIGFYDSLLIAAALAAGCTFFLSEDMNSGQKIEALTIVDPFSVAPEAVLGA
jgi:predicted nucleic acid-binding protein